MSTRLYSRTDTEINRLIDRRIIQHRIDLDCCLDRGEALNAEYLRGCISELEIIQLLIESLPKSAVSAADEPTTFRLPI